MLLFILVCLDCAGFWRHVWKLGQSGCAGCMGLETSPVTTLKLTSKGRAPCGAGGLRDA